METIQEYKIKLSDPYLKAPIKKIVQLKYEKDQIIIWARIDTEQKNRYFKFLEFKTGQDLLELKNFNRPLYLSTFRQPEDDLAKHLFYVELDYFS